MLSIVESDFRSLPAIILRASGRLLAARSSAEVLEAKHIAEAALHYAKVTQAANETHADCLRIITRAEIRMADEIDKGQAAGKIAKHGQHGEDVQTTDNLEIDRRRVAEWRAVRDAGEEKVERVIREALDQGRAPTKREVLLKVRGTLGTGENEWYTPPEFLDASREVLGDFDLDPASSDAAQRTVKAAHYFTADDDGLAQEWHGRVWLNPPYAQPHIADFVSKMVAERRAGRVTAGIMLTHNYTDTAWFHEAAAEADAICFTRGRIRFVDGAGVLASPTQGQAFFYFGPTARVFADRFASVGFVVEVIR